MGAMMTDAMASMVVMVMVVMPGAAMHGMVMPGGMAGLVACRRSREGRQSDCSTEEKYAEEFHWFLPIYLIIAMLELAF